MNRITIKNRYLISYIDDLIDKLRESTLFSKVDYAAGYYQMTINLKDTHKTAFVTKYGLFEYRVISMSLFNAPSTFIRFINSILYRDPSLRRHVLVYINDILIHSSGDRAEYINIF